MVDNISQGDIAVIANICENHVNGLLLIRKVGYTNSPFLAAYLLKVLGKHINIALSLHHWRTDAKSVLVYGNEFTVFQKIKRKLWNLTHVTSDEQRTAEHAPHRHVGNFLVR